jgi:hypothetical protein
MNYGAMHLMKGDGVRFQSRFLLFDGLLIFNEELLHIDQVSDPQIEPRPFENLVLDDGIKRTIASLVRNYMESRKNIKSWNVDFIKGKGEGLVFLLHGSPGVGKT